jgi:hypothetical protein
MSNELKYALEHAQRISNTRKRAEERRLQKEIAIKKEQELNEMQKDISCMFKWRVAKEKYWVVYGITWAHNIEEAHKILYTKYPNALHYEIEPVERNTDTIVIGEYYE